MPEALQHLALGLWRGGGEADGVSGLAVGAEAGEGGAADPAEGAVEAAGLPAGLILVEVAAVSLGALAPALHQQAEAAELTRLHALGWERARLQVPGDDEGHGLRS